LTPVATPAEHEMVILIAALALSTIDEYALHIVVTNTDLSIFWTRVSVPQLVCRKSSLFHCRWKYYYNITVSFQNTVL